MQDSLKHKKQELNSKKAGKVQLSVETDAELLWHLLDPNSKQSILKVIWLKQYKIPQITISSSRSLLEFHKRPNNRGFSLLVIHNKSYLKQSLENFRNQINPIVMRLISY